MDFTNPLRGSFGLAALLAFAGGLHAAGVLRIGAGTGHATLKSALAACNPGDTLVIQAGTYPEYGLIVDKPVFIRGEGRPVLDAGNRGTILEVRADKVEISGLTFRNVGVNQLKEDGAIWITGATGVVVADNRFERVFFGVYGTRVRHAEIRNNIFDGLRGGELSNGNGIHFWKSDSVTVSNNVIHGHRDGIYLEFTGDSRISGNICEANARYGLHFMFSHGNSFRGNTFRNNGAGVAVMYSHDVEMRENRFEHNWGPASYGLLLKSLQDSRIDNNLFEKNTVAIFQDESSRLALSGNTFRANGWALRLTADSDSNLFIANRFDGNTFDVAYNASPGNTNVFRRNSWDRYAGWDLDHDGVGDVPHRPVELFPVLIQNHPQAMALLRSHFATLLNLLERIFPTLSPATLEDTAPQMPHAAGAFNAEHA